MTRTDDPRAELLGIAESLRHLRGEHLRAGAESSARRKLEGAMRDEDGHLERRLTAFVSDEADRDAWRAHAHHGHPAPERPEAVEPVPAEQPLPKRPSGRRPWPR